MGTHGGVLSVEDGTGDNDSSGHNSYTLRNEKETTKKLLPKKKTFPGRGSKMPTLKDQAEARGDSFEKERFRRTVDDASNGIKESHVKDMREICDGLWAIRCDEMRIGRNMFCVVVFCFLLVFSGFAVRG